MLKAIERDRNCISMCTLFYQMLTFFLNVFSVFLILIIDIAHSFFFFKLKSLRMIFSDIS